MDNDTIAKAILGIGILWCAGGILRAFLRGFFRRDQARLRDSIESDFDDDWTDRP